MKFRRSRNLLCATLFTFALAPLGGCYSHVTQASGPGAERYKVHERNTDNIVLGKWFGESGSSNELAPPK